MRRRGHGAFPLGWAGVLPRQGGRWTGPRVVLAAAGLGAARAAGAWPGPGEAPGVPLFFLPGRSAVYASCTPGDPGPAGGGGEGLAASPGELGDGGVWLSDWTALSQIWLVQAACMSVTPAGAVAGIGRASSLCRRQPCACDGQDLSASSELGDQPRRLHTSTPRKQGLNK